MTLFNVMSEAQLVWFNLFTSCYFELLMIQVGKITNSSAAGMNFAQTIGLTLYETYCEGAGFLVSLNQVAATFDTSCDASTDEETGEPVNETCYDTYEEVGFYLGEIVKENMAWSVPTFKVN